MDLENAINSIDNLTNCYPLYYMINCAHLKHFIQVLSKNINKKWIKRIKGIRPNASKIINILIYLVDVVVLMKNTLRNFVKLV